MVEEASSPETEPRPLAGTREPKLLRRELGVAGATLLGLGSMLGTGIFVSIGLAASAAGPAVVLAIGLAALVAACNALSSAQLAALHPVSGGTYEYGYRWLNGRLGFAAGWMFLCAKCASAATAALGFAGYTLGILGQRDATARVVPLAVGGVGLLTALVLTGVRRSSRANAVIVSTTLTALALFVAAAVPAAWRAGASNLTPFFAPVTPRPALAGLLEACALMFVAYTGYGRVATLGEEVQDPHRTIPRAILATVGISLVLYVAVSFVAVAAVGAEQLSELTQGRSAPLEAIARRTAGPFIATLVGVGAISAMLGVLLNLILGLSRVVLAMGRRGDLPAYFARLETRYATPAAATLGVGLVITALVLLGNVKTTWSFSAFTVLIYYAITNLAALRLAAEQQRYPRWIAWCGLVGCLGLSFWVEARVWFAGLGLLALGLAWQTAYRAFARAR